MIVRFKRITAATALGFTLLTPVLAVSPALAETSSVTRGEFISLIASELKLSPGSSQQELPADVSADSPYADAVRVMLERKAMGGYSDGTFRLDQPISKSEAAYVIGRFLGLSDLNASATLKEDFGLDFGAEDGALSSSEAASLIQESLKSDASAKELLTGSSKTQSEFKTFRANMDLDIHIAFKPNPEIGMSDVQTVSHSEIEYNLEQGLHQKITMKLPMPGAGEQSIATEQYTVAEGTYMSVPDSITGQGTVWYDMTKQMPFTFDQFMNLQKANLEFSQAFVTPNFFFRDLGTVEADGKKLHKIGINGKITNAADIMKTLGSLDSSQSTFKDLADSPELAQMSIGVSATLTLDEATQAPVSMNGDYTVNYGDSPSMPIDHMDFKLSAAFKDFNAPVDIKLPAEAKSAKPAPVSPVAVPTDAATK